MTSEEKQEIINAVLAALMTNSKSIDQLTPVSEMSEADFLELNGGRKVSYGVLFANHMSNDDAQEAWEYLDTHKVDKDSRGLVEVHQATVVYLDAMGNLDGHSLNGSEGLEYRTDTKLIYDFPGGLFGAPKAGAVYISKNNLKKFVWNGTDLEELKADECPLFVDYSEPVSFATLPVGGSYYVPSSHKIAVKIDASNTKTYNPLPDALYFFRDKGMIYTWKSSTNKWVPAGSDIKVVNNLMDGGEGDALSAEQGKVLKGLIDNMGIDGSSIIKDVTYRNGDLVFTFETSEGDKVVNVPLDIDLSGYVPVTRKVNGKALSQDITIGQSDISGLTAALAALVPQTRTINGKALSSNVTIGMSDIQGLVDAINNAGSGAVSVTTNQDGTFTIHVGETDYTINLNHTHENIAKLIVCEESDLPSTLAKDTIYAQVDDAETPTEIQSLWIAGLEFVGGGGAIDDTPRLITPRDGLTLDFDGQSTIQLPVRGKNLLSDLSLTVTGDFTVTDGNNAAVSTIAATAANDGVVLRLTKGSNYYSGTLRIFSSEVDVTVTLERDISLPTGYSPLEAVSPNSMILSLADTNIPILSSWRIVLRSSSSSTQVVLCQNASSAGRYFGVVASSKWGVASAAAIDGLSVTAKTEALVEFGASLSKLTIGDNVTTITPATLQSAEGHKIELFGCSVGNHYYFSGYVYEIECVSGGSFHAFPAKRLSDNAVGLYDIENDVFYTGFSS